MPMDVKQAAEIAVRNLKDLMPKAENISFDEFEIVDEPGRREQFDITLGFDVLGEPAVSLVTDKLTEVATGIKTGPRRPRHFRIFSIDGVTGRVRGMKMRKRT